MVGAIVQCRIKTSPARNRAGGNDRPARGNVHQRAAAVAPAHWALVVRLEPLLQVCRMPAVATALTPDHPVRECRRAQLPPLGGDRRRARWWSGSCWCHLRRRGCPSMRWRATRLRGQAAGQQLSAEGDAVGRGRIGATEVLEANRAARECLVTAWARDRLRSHAQPRLVGDPLRAC